MNELKYNSYQNVPQIDMVFKQILSMDDACKFNMLTHSDDPDIFATN